MNEKDLRDCFAMFAMMGLVMRNEKWSPKDPWEIADDMIEARNKEPEQEIGIVAAKTRRKK